MFKQKKFLERQINFQDIISRIAKKKCLNNILEKQAKVPSHNFQYNVRLLS
jgi:hypothetical protein